MTENQGEPELNYIHTGLLGALLLNMGRADFVVGGCGTGQGFANVILQFPNVVCGFIRTPLDAWLFRRINGGNVISLSLNQGYGWAGEVNLSQIFNILFDKEPSTAYPPHRATAQADARHMLHQVNRTTHRSWPTILHFLDDAILKPVLEFPGILQILDIDSVDNEELKDALKRRIGGIM
jgi:ribose 5-phosphate isomerase RpiB